MKTPTVELYSAGGEHRWRLKHGNGRILAASSEGFSRKDGARRNFRRTRAAMNQVALIGLVLLTLALPLNAQTVTATNASGGITTTVNATPLPAFTTGTDILGGIGNAPKQVLTDGYLALKDISLTNPIAVNVFGLMNGTGKYGFGLEVNQADPGKLVNAGFAIAAIQTDQPQAGGGTKKGWNFYDATLNLSVQQTETIPLLNIPITVRIFSGPFVSLNGGTLVGEQSGVTGDINLKINEHFGFTGGGGVVNCAGAAAAGLKATMPMAHLALVWAPKGW